MKVAYITTPIYYVNGDPHIGHAHTDIMADILKRAETLKGTTVLLSTGTDEHGQKNQQAAEASGRPPFEFLEQQSQRFRTLFDSLDVGYDMWVRTTLPHHIRAVQAALQQLDDKGFLVLKEYTGLYCVGCEMFKRPSDLDENGVCPVHQQPPMEMKEKNYFFNLETFRPWLIGQLQERPEWIMPSFYRDEVLAMLQEPLEDLCISRPKNRVWLGIELPFDRDYVTYIWVDALLNYITNIGWPNEFREEYWLNSTHLMAKDIIKTHCVYWPIMLEALDLPVPSRFRIHGFWVGEGGVKMSKTIGNVVAPDEYIRLIGSDGLRYFLAKSMRSGDAQAYRALILETYNMDLVNKVGNLLSRVSKFVAKHCQGRVPLVDQIYPDDAELQSWTVEQAQNALAHVDLHTIHEYVKTIITIAERMNKYYETAAPWFLAGKEQELPRLKSILYVSLDCLRLLFELAYPVIPRASLQALEDLGSPLTRQSGGDFEFAANRVIAGTPIRSDTVLFPRVQV